MNPPMNSGVDESFLDAVFDRAIEELKAGRTVDVEDFVPTRPDLAVRVQEVLRLATEIVGAHGQARASLAGYEILEEVGRGSQGIVYRARQSSLQRVVALKVLAPSHAMSARARTRFASEARALARVSHPNVVRVHEVLETDEACAYAMEWIDGPTLKAVLARGTIPAMEACSLVVQIARALDAVHRSGLLHRDVKPSNILMRSSGDAVLSDFGLARLDDGRVLTRTGEFVGTLHYAAPEQLRGEGKALGPRSDVYSLGVTLYEALRGEPPFRANDTDGLLRQIARGAYRPLAKKCAGCPPALDKVVRTAIDPDPGLRYPSAGAFAADVDRVLRFEPVHTRGAPRSVRLARWAHSQRAVLVGFATLGLLVGIAIVATAAWVTGTHTRVSRAARLVRRGQLALLDPMFGNRAFASVHRGSRKPDHSRPFLRSATAALAYYRQALRLTSRRDTVLEHAVLSLVVQVLTPHSALVIPELLREVRPFTTYLAQALHSGAPTATVIEQLHSASRADRRAAGLLAFACGRADLCLEAWKLLGWPAEDALVDAAMGQYFLNVHDGGRAYVRLMRGFKAFPEAGFLAVDLADAALRNHDVEVARVALEEAKRLGLHDPAETLVRVEADLAAMDGDVETARAKYEHMLEHHYAPTARLHAGRFFVDHDLERGISILLQLADDEPGIATFRAAARKAVEPLWASLSAEARIEAITEGCRLGGRFADARVRLMAAISALAFRKEITTPRRTSPVLKTSHVSLTNLGVTLEVSRMNRLDRIHTRWRSAIARLALHLDSDFGVALAKHVVGGRFAITAATRLIVAAMGLFLANRAAAQSLIEHIASRTSLESLGISAANAGDVDRDGFDDLILGAHSRTTTTTRQAGAAYVISGRTGTVLHSLFGKTPHSVFGHSVTGAGDLDQDGHADVAVGAQEDTTGGIHAGCVRAYSGKDGTLLWQRCGAANERLGVWVAAVGDRNGDRIPDLLVGADSIWMAKAGYALLLSGANGATIKRFDGSASNDAFGFPVELVGDVNRDGTPDFAVGAWQWQTARAAGYVDIYSGKPPYGRLKQLTGLATGGAFGAVAGIGDIDRDGHADLVVGAAWEDHGNLVKAGAVHVYSGRTFGLLYTVRGRGAGDEFGVRVASVGGDVNKDGVPDFLAGAPFADVNGADSGSAVLISGKDGQVLQTLHGKRSQDTFGHEVAGNLDWNADGKPDFLVGAPGASGPLKDGFVTVHSGSTLSLQADRRFVDRQTGGTQSISLDAGKAHAGKFFLFLGSTNTKPPIDLGNGVIVRLRLDGYTLISIPGFFSSSVGILDNNGRASTRLTLPPGIVKRGPLALYHAALVLRLAPPSFDFATNSVQLTIR